MKQQYVFRDQQGSFSGLWEMTEAEMLAWSTKHHLTAFLVTETKRTLADDLREEGRL